VKGVAGVKWLLAEVEGGQRMSGATAWNRGDRSKSGDNKSGEISGVHQGPKKMSFGGLGIGASGQRQNLELPGKEAMDRNHA
jgi:hypothetical protein